MRIILISLLLTCAFFVVPTTVSAFNSQYYTANSDQWIVKKLPDGNSFLCLPCTNEIRISIKYGPEHTKLTPTFFDEFLISENNRLEMAESTIRQQIPSNLEPEIEILNNTYEKMFGIQVLAFHAVVYLENYVLRDTTYMGIHKNRIFRVTLNYIDGDMDEVAAITLDKFFSSLRFNG